jgi:hypothetical protein
MSFKRLYQFQKKPGKKKQLKHPNKFLKSPKTDYEMTKKTLEIIEPRHFTFSAMSLPW